MNDGEWVASVSEKPTFDVVDQATLDTFVTLPTKGEEDVKKVRDAAHEAFKTCKKTSAPERARTDPAITILSAIYRDKRRNPASDPHGSHMSLDSSLRFRPQLIAAITTPSYRTGIVLLNMTA